MTPRTPDGDISLDGIAINGFRKDHISAERLANSYVPDKPVSLPPIKIRAIELASNSIQGPASHDPSSAMDTLANAAGSRGRIPVTQAQEQRLRSERSRLPLQSGESKTASVGIGQNQPRQQPSTSSYDRGTLSASASFHPDSQATQGDSASQSHAMISNNNISAVATATPSQPPASSSSSSSPTLVPSERQDSLSILESQLTRLRQYADELSSLSMEESQQLLQREIQSLEQKILSIKKERSEKLLHGLESEFPGLVGLREGIKKEGSKLGYF
jgi:hypothetical protein